MNRKYLQILFLQLSLAIAQNCREYSQSCVDSVACCGGCCIDQICQDVYADCRKVADPCLDHYCPPDEECYIYHPDDCEGCGPVRDCRSVPTPPEEVTDTVKMTALNFSTKIVLCRFYLILILCPILVVF